jgi:hypothetical protein
VLDVSGRNRYVMTRTENLAALLDLPATTLEVDGNVLRNTGAVAALGIVAEHDVVDLLPGEERDAGALREGGWNARV